MPRRFDPDPVTNDTDSPARADELSAINKTRQQYCFIGEASLHCRSLAAQAIFERDVSHPPRNAACSRCLAL